MKELVLSRQYAVIALDGLESLHPSMAKSAVIRAIAAAKVMEEVMHTEAESDPAVFIPKLNEAVEGVKDLRKKDEKQIEEEMAALLEADGLMEQIPDILGYIAVTRIRTSGSEKDCGRRFWKKV